MNAFTPPQSLAELLAQRNEAFRAKTPEYRMLTPQIKERLQKEGELVEIVPDENLNAKPAPAWRREPLSKWLSYLSRQKPEMDNVLHRSGEVIQRQLETGVFRCFALCHPDLPDQLTAVAYGAPKQEIARSYKEAFLPPGSHTRSLTLCSVAIPGDDFLGLDTKETLLKRIVSEVPQRGWDVATLSPMDVRPWLDKLLADPANAPEVEKMLRQWGAGAKEIEEIGLGSRKKNTCEGLATLLKDWAGSDEVPTVPMPDALKMPFARLCMVYLRGLKKEEGKADRPNDPTLELHIGRRAATLAGLNLFADPSPEGMKRSYGTLVNYWSRGKPPVEPAHTRW